MPLTFEYPEDERFFTGLLWRPGESIEDYAAFFDFGDPVLKRRQYQRLRDEVLAEYTKRFGMVCHLRRRRVPCSPEAGLTIDHLIPIMSNQLNKQLRNLGHERGKKVAQQSLGSNHPVNLVLACAACNANKKNSLPTRDEFRAIVTRLGAASG
jgi:5-methylcytosine-specific restriction endonuclease McrA